MCVQGFETQENENSNLCHYTRFTMSYEINKSKQCNIYVVILKLYMAIKSQFR